MQRDSIEIILAADESYAMPLATTMRSVVDTHVGALALNFRVLADGITPESCRKIRESCPPQTNIEFIDFQNQTWPHPEDSAVRYLSRASCLRALIEQSIPESVERVLYLDTDLLVLDDVEGLWRLPLDEGSAFAAVVDAVVPSHGAYRKGPDAHPRADDDLPYFNAGVLLIDMAVWRAEAIGRRTLDVLAAPGGVLPYADQDALNYVAAGMWTALDPAWNCPAECYYRRWDLPSRFRNPLPYSNVEPKILHFCGKDKPWRSDYPFRVGWRAYRRVRDRTAWPTGALERVASACTLKYS